jgi:SPP1 family predicted phage head-tail adaptor
MDQNISINPGKLRHKIILQTLTTQENAVGEEGQVYQDYQTVFASVQALKGNQYIEAKKARPELTFRVTIRYRPGVTNDMRIKYSKQNEPDRYFIIDDIINISECNRMLEIMCYEKVYKDVN